MKNLSAVKRILAVLSLSLLSFVTAAEGAKVTRLMHKELRDLVNKEGLMVMVEYAPGMSSKKHRHNAHSFIYVLEGSIIMQVSGGDPVTLEAGQTFYESPKDIHLVSKNASRTRSAKFIVFSLNEKNSPVVIPVP